MKKQVFRFTWLGHRQPIRESNGAEAAPAPSGTEEETSAAQALAQQAVIPESVGVEENYNNDDESSADQMDIDYEREDGY